MLQWILIKRSSTLLFMLHTIQWDRAASKETMSFLPCLNSFSWTLFEHCSGELKKFLITTQILKSHTAKVWCILTISFYLCAWPQYFGVFFWHCVFCLSLGKWTSKRRHTKQDSTPSLVLRDLSGWFFNPHEHLVIHTATLLWSPQPDLNFWIF